MKQVLDLDTFANMLTEKGYDGYFLTESDYAGTIKESINGFLEACGDGRDAPLVADKLHLSTYIEWNGEDRPRAECIIWAKYENGKFDLRESQMYIRRTDRYGQVLKETRLADLAKSSFPTAREALAKVSETSGQTVPSQRKKFGMR